jgi:hypothetical protein
MKIVQFKDGQYAIRSGWVFYFYKDLKGSGWLSLSSRWIEDCKTPNLKDIQCHLNSLIDKGKPI